MVKIKISELLGKNKMTRKQLSEIVGVRPNTIGDLYKGNVKKVDLNLLDSICKKMKCHVEDILEYVEDGE